MLIALWPRHWSRQQRSNATLVAALVLMVVMLALLGQILSLFPEPIGSNAQTFSDGARTTLWLTLISGTVGLILGTAAALARTFAAPALYQPAQTGDVYAARYRRYCQLTEFADGSLSQV